jgi:cell wall-associated protease
MKHCISLCLLLASLTAIAQTQPKVHGWHLLDKEKDSYYGISLNRAYELLKGRPSHTVIVAVIDSGIDTAHEDLQPVLWNNPKEVPGNGKDDDGNGYTDDLHGWNFCGAPDGTNLDRNTHEIARVYHKWKTAFEGQKESNIPDSLRFLYGQWKKSEQLLDEQYKKAIKELPRIEPFYNALTATNRLLTAYIEKSSFTRKDIPNLTTADSMGFAVRLWNNVMENAKDENITNTAILSDIEGYRNQQINSKKRKEDTPEDLRGQLTKDVYTDINDRIYGNNNLKTGSGNHGTHVSGIIAASRNNGKGMDGIADNVRIMALRAVPGGDEHDKDVALAIRYAVENGASIINMSFGKPVSPYKKMVDDAIQYAAAKGVLLVHGAGNDGQNLDETIFYPNPIFLNGQKAVNMLTVGASGDPGTDNIAAPFSNYSKNMVDVFAPGMYIYSTTTGNGYEANDGTSMASPVAAGVAALLKSYFPQLTPEQLIDLVTTTGTTVTEKVIVPGTEKKKEKLSELSRCGCIINAYSAVKKALELYGQ